MLIKNILIVITAVLLIAGCSSNDSDETKTEALTKGRFFDGNISGVTYECASGTTGTTTGQGEFFCPQTDATVTFKVGNIVLGSATVGDIDPQTLMEENETRMINMMRLLLSVDSDHNASNGIDVDPALVTGLGGIDFSGTDFGNDLENSLGGEAVSEEVAIAYLTEHFGYMPSSSSSSEASSSDSSESSEQSSAASSESSENATSSSSSSLIQPPAVSSSSISSQVSSASSSSVQSSVSSSSSSVSAPLRSKAAAPEVEPSNWYVRLVAEAPARSMKTQSAEVGALEVSDAVENQSLKSLQPFGGSYLDIVFVNPEGLPENEYKSNFHVHSENAADSWRFTVKSDDVQSDLIVTWRGLFVLKPYVDAQGRTRYHEYRSLTNPLLKKMQVIDERSGEVLPVSVNGQAPAFIVNMDGQNTRTFRWELLTQNSNATARSAAPLRVQKNARAFIRSASKPKPLEFDLSKPPMFK